jgi:hypothetical protein
MLATTVLRLSPQREGLAGSAHLPGGEAVPIGDILSTVLARYGLPENRGEGVCQGPNQSAGDVQFDALA